MAVNLSDDTFLFASALSSRAEPTLLSRSNSRSPVLLRPGTAFCKDRSLVARVLSPKAVWNTEGMLSVQLLPTVAVGTVVPVLIRASTLGPELAGAVNLSWLCILGSN